MTEVHQFPTSGAFLPPLSQTKRRKKYSKRSMHRVVTRGRRPHVWINPDYLYLFEYPIPNCLTEKRGTTAIIVPYQNPFCLLRSMCSSSHGVPHPITDLRRGLVESSPTADDEEIKKPRSVRKRLIAFKVWLMRTFSGGCFTSD